MEFNKAANGIVGLETAVGLSLELVQGGVLTKTQLVAKLSTNPARILQVPGGSLQVGAPADITVLDPDMSLDCGCAAVQIQEPQLPF